MSNRNYKAFIVEGEKRERQIINSIEKVFFERDNFEVITLPAKENIYMLWKELAKDDFETDIIEVLREKNISIARQLEGLSRSDFSEIYLFFDFDVHNQNLSKSDDKDAIEKMLLSFDNETENGKLFISYPMVEALRDFKSDVCGGDNNCYIRIEDMKYYKNISAENSENNQISHYDMDKWKEIIDVFAMRLACLFGQSNVMKYKYYVERMSPYTIYCKEKVEADDGRVFVLSGFPEFLVDYFGEKMWKECVIHKENGMGMCRWFT